MRDLSFEQELEALRDQVAKVRSGGCPETYRLPERGWLLVHQALIRATTRPEPVARSRRPARPRVSPA